MLVIGKVYSIEGDPNQYTWNGTTMVRVVSPAEVAALAPTPKLTKDQHKAATARGILKSLGADTSVVDGLIPPKAAKPVPAFITKRAENRAPLAAALANLGVTGENPNKALAALCRSAGWTPDDMATQWGMAKEVALVATTREHLVSLLYALAH